MNNFYFIFSLINIFAIQIHGKALTNEETIYDIVTKNFSTTCPIFNKNVIVNNLSDCKGITLSKLPKRLTILNLNIFYCIGEMVADFELCNSISHSDYQYLPKSTEELNAQLTKMQHQNTTSVCMQLKNMKLFNTQNIPKELTETVAELKAKLSGPLCSKICSDITGENVSELCGMMSYLNLFMINITKDVATTSKDNKHIVTTPKEQKQPEQQTPPVTHANQNKNTVINQLPVNTNEHQSHENVQQQLPVNTNEHQSVNENVQQQLPVNAIDQHQLAVDHHAQQQKIPSVDKPKVEPTKISTTTPSQLPHSNVNQQPETRKQETPAPAPEDTNQEQQLQLNTQMNAEEPPKQVQPVEPKGESQNQLTNGATNENADNKVKNLDFTSAEEKEYPVTSTASNYLRSDIQNSDNFALDIETEDDEDEDGISKLGDVETNIEMKDSILNSRMEISPNSKMPEDIEESNFFSYFMFISIMFIAGYVVYHNKQKIMALLLEGRRERNSRRRPSTSSYRKLNSNLEEAVTSKCSGSASHVIY